MILGFEDKGSVVSCFHSRRAAFEGATHVVMPIAVKVAEKCPLVWTRPATGSPRPTYLKLETMLFPFEQCSVNLKACDEHTAGCDSELDDGLLPVQVVLERGVTAQVGAWLIGQRRQRDARHGERHDG